MPVTVRYRFSQDLPLPPKEAYLWCTDYTAQDHALMGNGNAERQVVRLTDAVLILKDVIRAGCGVVENQKLVHLYPERLCWVSTHLIGTNRYSQFTYQVIAKGDKASQLQFSALHVDHEKESISTQDAEALAKSMCQADSMIWRLLAEAMKKDLCR
jgi:hypothetical protein